MHLSSIDLNLFWVLHTVLAQGSVTEAAKALHVTQSAVSNSLARLRELFDDPLLVRNGRRLVPTPRALELQPLIEDAMSKLQAAATTKASFDPKQCTQRVTVATSDAELVVDIPKLAELFSRRLPRASLRAVTIDYLIATDGLATGAVDLVIGYARAMRPSWHQRELYTDIPALVVRRDHPDIGKRITREQFAKARHVDVHLQLGDPGEGNRDAHRAMADEGLERPVSLVVPSFTAAALAAARADYVAALPKRLARFFCEHLPLRMLPMPFSGLEFPAALAWHPRTDADLALAYARELVVEALAARSSRPKTSVR
jgi:DNA-binding transcriptional LysR family regulator